MGTDSLSPGRDGRRHRGHQRALRAREPGAGICACPRCADPGWENGDGRVAQLLITPRHPPCARRERGAPSLPAPGPGPDPPLGTRIGSRLGRVLSWVAAGRGRGRGRGWRMRTGRRSRGRTRPPRPSPPQRERRGTCPSTGSTELLLPFQSLWIRFLSLIVT